MGSMERQTQKRMENRAAAGIDDVNKAHTMASHAHEPRSRAAEARAAGNEARGEELDQEGEKREEYGAFIHDLEQKIPHMLTEDIHFLIRHVSREILVLEKELQAQEMIREKKNGTVGETERSLQDEFQRQKYALQLLKAEKEKREKGEIDKKI
jgi:ABC-type bacteriocin/lantibiotic exporter with double-glycine peptidase domain